MSEVLASQPLPPRRAWEGEAAFNRWLARPGQLAQLATLAGHRLELLQLEAAVGSGRIDILCHCAKARAPVVIEAKLGAADPDHLGRVLGYVDELGAACGIYVAASFGRALVEAVAALPFAVHLVEAHASRIASGDVVCQLSRAAGSPRPAPGEGAEPCSVVTAATRAEAGAGLARLVRAARRAGLLARTGVDLDPAAIPDWRQPAQAALLAMWPNRPQHALVAATLGLLARHRATRLVVLLRAIDEGAASKLALMAKLAPGCAVVPLELVAQAKGKAKGRWQARRFALGPAPGGGKAGFWREVATILRRRSLAVRAVSVKGVFVAFARAQARLVAFERASPSCLCIELRLSDENSFDAAESFAQLRRHARPIERGLASLFKLSWLADRARVDDQVLKLGYRREHQATPAVFAAAIVKAHEVLAEPVARIERSAW